MLLDGFQSISGKCFSTLIQPYCQWVILYKIVGEAFNVLFYVSIFFLAINKLLSLSVAAVVFVVVVIFVVVTFVRVIHIRISIDRYAIF